MKGILLVTLFLIAAGIFAGCAAIYRFGEKDVEIPPESTVIDPDEAEDREIHGW